MNSSAKNTDNRQGDSGTVITEHTGFPNPATDSMITGLNLSTLLIKNPASTFMMRIEGSQWENMGIFDGDIAIIDRSLTPTKKDLVARWDDFFVLSKPAQLPPHATVWGVVSSIVHTLRKS